MRPVSLVVLALLPLVVLAITEYLFQSSVKETGLFQSESSEGRLIFRTFVSQFFSLLVVVLTGLFFQSLDLAVKTMEPFYHLSKVKGANGAQTLLVDYYRPLLYFTPFQAAQNSHWAVFCSSFANIIATNVLPTLALGVFGVSEDEAPMDPTFTHGLEAFCGVITLLTLLLWVILGRRRSGLLSFPDNLEAFIEFTSGLDPDNSLHELFQPLAQSDDIDEKMLGATLKRRQFGLLRREASLKSPLDIVLLEGKTSSDPTQTPPSQWNRTKKSLSKPFQPLARFWQKSLDIKPGHPNLFQTRPMAVLITVLLGLFIIADGQMFWAQSSSFFTFVGERRFARSTISTLITTIIWAPIRKNASLMEPFYRLTRPNGVTKNALDLKAEWPFQDLIHSIRSVRNTQNRRVEDYCMTFIMVGAYAANLFVVTWNILALDGETFGPGFWISYGLQLTCEVLMAIALVAIFVWRRTPILPILPVTIASNLFYVYATDLPAGRFQDFQQRINYRKSSYSSEALGERRENSSQSTSGTIVSKSRNDAGESQTKPPNDAVNDFKNDNESQTEKLSEPPPSPRIATSQCVNGTQSAETLSRHPTFIASSTTVEKNPALALETAEGTDSYIPAKCKSDLESSTPRIESGAVVQISPGSKTIHSGEKSESNLESWIQRINSEPAVHISPGPETSSSGGKSAGKNESEIMCGFGYFKGRDQQMHLGVGRSSSIESKYIYSTVMNRNQEVAV